MINWVRCPICLETDMRREAGIIQCTNLACNSNQAHIGHRPVSDDIADLTFEDMIAQAISPNGYNNIEVRNSARRVIDVMKNKLLDIF